MGPRPIGLASAAARHSLPLCLICQPLVEVGTRGTALTRGGTRALAELAKRGITAVLSGHARSVMGRI